MGVINEFGVCVYTHIACIYMHMLYCIRLDSIVYTFFAINDLGIYLICVYIGYIVYCICVLHKE